jgi:hypothetical protein
MSNDRLGALAVAAGPLVLLAGILWHPFIPDLRDGDDVARHLQDDTTTWFGAHLLVAIGAAVLLLGFLAARAHIRTSVGREPWTGRAVVPLVLGSMLFVMLPAMEIGMLAVEAANGDVAATQAELYTWFMPLTFASAAILGVGTILFAVGVHKARVLPAALDRTVVAALVASALTRLPFTAALIAGVVALNVAMLPLAATMWRAGGVPKPRTVAYELPAHDP